MKKDGAGGNAGKRSADRVGRSAEIVRSVREVGLLQEKSASGKQEGPAKAGTITRKFSDLIDLGRMIHLFKRDISPLQSVKTAQKFLFGFVIAAV